MMRYIKHGLIPFLLLIQCVATAQIRLPQLVGDGMVLQRNKKINIWGWASPAEKVSVKFQNKTYKTTASANGNWQIQMPPIKAGGPYVMHIDGSNHLIIKDILIGDVWFCSGQSNMALLMERVKEKYPEEITSANHPQIRNFFVQTVSNVSQQATDLPPGKWIKADTGGVLTFGATSYFFAKALYLKYHVPIGIINSSVGGTPIQAWISADGFSINNSNILANYESRIANFKDTAYLNKLLHPAMPMSSKPIKNTDMGLSGPVKWYETNYTPKGWHPFWMPGYWADQGVRGLNGVVWFRKELDIPVAMAGKPAKLFLGRLIDADETYLNGKQVGNTTYQYPPRRYDIPEGLLKAGKNVIVVRLTNTSSKGGFVPEKPYVLTNGSTNIDLRGDWQYKVGQVFTPLRGQAPANTFSAQNEPSGLYNTMVAPAINYAIKGFVWYQGETNTGKPNEYRELLPALITNWRNKWKDDKLPFIYAQLPNFMEVQYSPSESQWAELRDAQLHTLNIPFTGMAVTIDAGEWNDIHPLNKKDVGERLALAAQNVAYNDKTVVGSGPVYQSALVVQNKIEITFNNTGGELMVKGDGELTQFAIAGADKVFVWAKAKIEGNKVIVYSDEVPTPKYVRYAWADNPEDANLYNKAGLPASPFRTDQ